jgi:hypothetical protein
VVDYLVGLAKLRELTRSWGGGIVEVPFRDPLWNRESISAAPFCFKLGVDYKEKTIFMVEGAELGSIIHEMGHIFASRWCPAESAEYNFFGWEFMVAVKLGLVDEWLDTTGDYTVGGNKTVEFCEMTIDEQSDLIEERVQHARKIGLVVGEEPIAIR